MAQVTDHKQTELKTGGDDLDDGLELDENLLASDDEEDDNSEIADVTLDDGLDGEDPLVEEVDVESDDEDLPSGSRKRKAGSEVVEEGDEDAKKAEKKRRRKEKNKERRARKEQERANTASSTIPTHFSPGDLSAVLLRSIRESFPSASAVELEDLVLPNDNLLSPPSYPVVEAEPGSFKPLQKRITSLLDPLQKKKLANGAPQVIVLSLSGLRCADVVRGVRDVKGKGEVAKLFAKHFKLADQIKYLEKTKVSIAVGTPARVGKLLSEGALKINSDTVILLDIGHQDSKTRTILTLPEVRDELWKNVFSGSARKTLFEGGARVGAF